MKTAAAPVPLEPDNYAPHWAAFFLLLLGAIFALRFNWQGQYAQAPQSLTSTFAVDDHANWFYVLRMPEVFDHKTQTELAQRRMVQWLSALKEAGFRPLSLAVAKERLSKGQGLPENSVMLVFDPGYRHTYDSMAPILAQQGWPAVWSTPEEALKRGDTHYVSQHRTEKMSQSGWWDVLRYGAGEKVWIDHAKAALNMGSIRDGMYRLSVDATWTKQELINRLLAERPLQEPSYLTLHEIQTQRWGIVSPVTTAEPSEFRFQAPPDQRGAWLSWQGTRGISNIGLQVDVTSLTGELWVMLRSDNKQGNSIRIAFANGRIVVEEEKEHQRSVLTSTVVPAMRQPGSFTADIHLSGSTLSVSINHLRQLTTFTRTPTSSDSVVRLAIYDKITGVAQAGSVNLLATPLE